MQQRKGTRVLAKKSLFREYLKQHYQLLLWGIIVVFIINEATMFKTYKNHVNTTDIINQAGRQRMFSQKIAKLTLYYEKGDLFALQELHETVTRWSLTHRNFMDENSSLSTFYYSSPLIRQNFEELSVSQQAIENAVYEMVARPNADHSVHIATVMDQERRFLVLMDTIVNQMEAEASQSYYKVTVIEIVIGTITFLGVTVIIFLLMVPVIKNLRERERLLTISINKKEALLAEIHHRVKNNLAVVSGMIQLQLMNKDFSRNTFENAIDRVQSIASIHEFLYTEKEYSTVRIDHYINELIKKLSNSYPQLGSKVRINVISDSIEFDSEKTVPFSLLLNELITNSMKHAFREGDLGQIDIVLTEYDKESVFFKYQDNGRGDTYSLKGISGIGMQLINALADQLDCALDISFSPGFILTTTFRIK